MSFLISSHFLNPASDHLFFQHPLSSQLFFSSSFSCFCLIVLTWTSLLQNYSWDPFSVWLPDSKLYRTSAWFWLGSKYGDPVGLFYCHFEGLHQLLYHHFTSLPHAFWPSLNSCHVYFTHYAGLSLNGHWRIRYFCCFEAFSAFLFYVLFLNFDVS